MHGERSDDVRALGERVAEDAPHALLCSDARQLSDEARLVVDDRLARHRNAVPLELLADSLVEGLQLKL